MSVSAEYRDFVLEQLECVGQVTGRNMFGGVGLYHNGLFFALIHQDTLFFKVDNRNRPDFEAAGMSPFRPYKNKSIALQYFEVPIDVLENWESLASWARKAIAAARASKTTKRAGRSSKKTKISRIRKRGG